MWQMVITKWQLLQNEYFVTFAASNNMSVCTEVSLPEQIGWNFARFANTIRRRYLKASDASYCGNV